MEERSRVQVRRRRGDVELRVDGTFASWYRPGRVCTGSVWDALAAPILLLPPARRRSLLVLGVGAGSAARVLRALAPRARIVGVERDAEVLRVARQSFDLGGLGLEVVCDDALDFLRRARRRFDLVVEDVFVGRGRRLHKPAGLPRPGLEDATRRLAPGGILVTNQLDELAESRAVMRDLFPSILSIELPDYDNRVLVGGRWGDARLLRSRVASCPLLSPTLPRLRFRTLR